MRRWLMRARWIAQHTLPTRPDNMGLTVSLDDRCSVAFLLVVEFMVLGGRDIARMPIYGQENDYGSQPKHSARQQLPPTRRT